LPHLVGGDNKFLNSHFDYSGGKLSANSSSGSL
jgi:hypothetical protein